MFTPVEFTEDSCLADELPTVFDNLDFIKDCSETNSSQFTCSNFRGSVTEQIQSDICFTVRDNDGLVNPNNAINEQKMLLFTYTPDYSVNVGGNNASFSAVRSITILCDGQIIGQVADSEGIIPFCFDCPRTAKIEICVESTVVANSIFAFGTATMDFCGSLICITETSNGSIPSFFNPRIDTSCCYGREAIHLAMQNLEGLRGSLNQFGQIPSCISQAFEDDADHVLLSNATTNAEFLVVGTIEVCVENDRGDQDSLLRVTPRISCAGNDQDCLTKLFTVRNGDSVDTGRAGVQCFSVPVVSCGICPAGSSLIVGVRERIDCDESAPALASALGRVISVEQHYCVYTFERAQNDFATPLNRSIGKCLSLDNLNQISSAMDQLNQICESQSNIELTFRDISGFTDGAQNIEIQEALPWPPTNDPNNTDSVPVKKWFFVGNLTYELDTSQGNNESASNITVMLNVLCGGVEVATGTSDPIFNQGGGRISGELHLNQCIECPIDEPIEINITAIRQGVITTIASQQYDYSAKIFCF